MSGDPALPHAAPGATSCATRGRQWKFTHRKTVEPPFASPVDPLLGASPQHKPESQHQPLSAHSHPCALPLIRSTPEVPFWKEPRSETGADNSPFPREDWGLLLSIAHQQPLLPYTSNTT